MINQIEAVKGNKFNILLAEDDPANQLLIERYLVMAGHTVTVVENGKEALDLLDKVAYQLCIFDMQMPEMTGLEAIDIYKKNNPNSKLPFIILTANTEKDAIAQCKQAGADMHLAKPIQYARLVEAINSVMGKEIETTCLNSEIIDVNGMDYSDDLKNSLDGNHEEFKKVVHSIKGLSGNVAAHTLRELTIQAEKLNNDDYKIKSAEYYKKIADELLSVKTELVKLYKK